MNLLLLCLWALLPRRLAADSSSNRTLNDAFRNLLHWSPGTEGTVVRPVALTAHARACVESGLCVLDERLEEEPLWSLRPTAEFSENRASPISVAVATTSETEAALSATEQYAIVDLPGSADSAWSNRSVTPESPDQYWTAAHWFSPDLNRTVATPVATAGCAIEPACSCGSTDVVLGRQIIFKFPEWGVQAKLTALPRGKIRDVSLILDEDFSRVQAAFLTAEQCTLLLAANFSTFWAPASEDLCDCCGSQAAPEYTELVLEPSPAVCDTVGIHPLSSDLFVVLYTVLLRTPAEQLEFFGNVKRDSTVRVQKYRFLRRLDSGRTRRVELVNSRRRAAEEPPLTFEPLMAAGATDVAKVLPLGLDIADLRATFLDGQMVAVALWLSAPLFSGNWTSRSTPHWANGLAVPRVLGFGSNGGVRQMPHKLGAGVESTLTPFVLDPDNGDLCWQVESLTREAVMLDLRLYREIYEGVEKAGVQVRVGQNSITGTLDVTYDAVDHTLRIRWWPQSLANSSYEQVVSTNVSRTLTRLVVFVDRSIVEVFGADVGGWLEQSLSLAYVLRTPRVDLCVSGSLPDQATGAIRSVLVIRGDSTITRYKSDGTQIRASATMALSLVLLVVGLVALLG